MLDDVTFKTIIDSAPLISIDILARKNNKVLLGKRVNKPAQGYFFQLVAGLIKVRQLTVRWVV